MSAAEGTLGLPLSPQGSGCNRTRAARGDLCLGDVRGRGLQLPVPGAEGAGAAGCTLVGQGVQLCLHYEDGFTISREEPGGSAILFRYPYERLKMSADDGIRTLYLDFGGPEGELVRRGQPGSPPDLGGLPPGLAPASPIPAASQLP